MSGYVAWIRANFLWIIFGLALAFTVDVVTSIYADVPLGDDPGGLLIVVGTTMAAMLLGSLARRQEEAQSRCLAGGIGMGLVVILIFILFVEDRGFVALVPPIAAVKALYCWGVAWGTVLILRRRWN